MFNPTFLWIKYEIIYKKIHPSPFTYPHCFFIYWIINGLAFVTVVPQPSTHKVLEWNSMRKSNNENANSWMVYAYTSITWPWKCKWTGIRRPCRESLRKKWYLLASIERDLLYNLNDVMQVIHTESLAVLHSHVTLSDCQGWSAFVIYKITIRNDR